MYSNFFKLLLFLVLLLSAVFIPLHVTAEDRTAPNPPQGLVEAMSRPPFVANWPTYMIYSGDAMTFRWEHAKAGGEINYYGGDAPTEFRVSVYHWERNLIIITGTVSAYGELSFPVTFPATGHYRISVRACNDAGCSKHCHSTEIDCGKIDGVPSPFWIYATVKPVGEISIE